MCRQCGGGVHNSFEVTVMIIIHSHLRLGNCIRTPFCTHWKGKRNKFCHITSWAVRLFPTEIVLNGWPQLLLQANSSQYFFICFHYQILFFSSEQKWRCESFCTEFPLKIDKTCQSKPSDSISFAMKTCFIRRPRWGTKQQMD